LAEHWSCPVFVSSKRTKELGTTAPDGALIEPETLTEAWAVAVNSARRISAQSTILMGTPNLRQRSFMGMITFREK
jgi:hypothetical protein